MSQPRHTVDQIIAKLRRADVELDKGKTVPDACKVLGKECHAEVLLFLW